MMSEIAEYLTDDQDVCTNRLCVMSGGNGDWYIGVDFPCRDNPELRDRQFVRVTTSGIRVPGLAVAVADAYRAIKAATPTQPETEDTQPPKGGA